MSDVQGDSKFESSVDSYGGKAKGPVKDEDTGFESSVDSYGGKAC